MIIGRRLDALFLTNTGVNPAGDAWDTSPNILVGGDVNGNIPPNIITYFRI